MQKGTNMESNEFDRMFNNDIKFKMRIITGLITTIEDIFNSMGLTGVKDMAMRKSFVMLVQKLIVDRANSQPREVKPEDYSRAMDEAKESIESVGDILKNINFDDYKLGENE